MQQNHKLRLLFSLIFLSSLVSCQDQIIQKIIQLTDNEQYYLDLSSFYSQTIQSINLPPSSMKLVSYPPSQITNTYTTAPSMNYLLPTSFPVNNNQKYVAQVISVLNATSQAYDFYLVFGSVLIANNSIQSQEITRSLLLSNNVDISEIYTSLYSATQGFAYVTLDSETQTVFQFSFSTTTNQLTLTQIKTTSVIYDPKSLVVNSDVFLFSTELNTISIYLFNSTTLALDVASQQVISCQSLKRFQEISNIENFYIVRACNDFILFISSDINQSQSKAILKVPNSSSYNVIFSQIVNKIIQLIFIDDINLMICSFNYSNQASNIYLKQCVHTSLNSIFTNAVFVTDSIILLTGSTQLQLYDINLKRVIYTQSALTNQQFSFYNFLNNLVLININQLNGAAYQYLNTQSIQLNSPGLLLYSDPQTVNFNITVGPIPMLYQCQVTVNVVSSQSITFTSPSVTVGQTYQGQTYNSSSIFNFPIENYITGSSLQYLQLTSTSNQIQNMVISQYNSSSTQSPFSVDNTYSVFKIEQGPFNTLIQQTTATNSYLVSYGVVNSETQVFTTISLESGNPLDSAIATVDSQGSFTVQSDAFLVQKRIFMPAFYQDGTLYLNILQVQCDPSKNSFSFSSDISISLVIVICGSSATSYNLQPQFKTPFNPTISSQISILGNFASSSNILTLNGIAFIYGSTSITAFDYVNSILIGTAISVPQLSPNQQQTITLFRESFFVFYNNLSNTTLFNQYSYNGFATQTPLLLRNGQIDPQNPLTPNTLPIALRNSDTSAQEYILFNTLGSANSYAVFKANNCNSQNQLYGIIVVQTTGLIVYSPNSICQLGQNFNCSIILPKAMISVQLNISQSYYASQVMFPLPFTVSISNGGTSQNYQFILKRDTSALYGTINQTAQSIQTLKTFIQDSKEITTNTTLQLSDGSDSTIFNGNLLGWNFYSSQGQIVNRLQSSIQQPQSSTVFTILYNQALIVSNTNVAIGSLIIVSNIDFSQCVGLEDSSQTQYMTSYTQLNLYFICTNTIFFYQIQLNKENNSYSSSKILTQNSFLLTQDIPIPTVFNKIFSSSSSVLNLFGNYKILLATLTLDTNAKSATLQAVEQSSSVFISQNIIQSFSGLILQFQTNGNIITTLFNSTDASQSSLYNIKTLLSAQQFIISSNDNIVAIQQISDQIFNIQFQYSQIFQVTFAYTKNNLSISTVSSYDYLDGFSQMIGYYQGSTYTLFVGQNNSSQIIVNLYNNGRQTQNYNLINAWSQNNFELPTISVASIGANNSTQFNIFLTNGCISQLSISENTYINLNTNQIAQKDFTLTPFLNAQPYNRIGFSLIPSTPTTSSILILKVISILLILLC